MPTRRIAPWMLIGLLAGPVHALRVVATSGTQVDGVGIAGFDQVQADGGAVYFRSTSTSVVAGGLSFATGDPLPAGLTGTIEELVLGHSAGSLAAVLLLATGPDATDVWQWDAVRGARLVAHGTRATRRAGRSPIALHAPEGLAIGQRTDAQLWPSDGFQPTTLVMEGEEIEGLRIRRLYGDVGFLD